MATIQVPPSIYQRFGKKPGEYVKTAEMFIVMQKSAAHEIPNLRVSPLGAVVTHKVRIINDFSFEPRRREKKGGLNADTDADSVPQCLRAEARPKFISELVSLRQKDPTRRVLMSKADVSDAFRNVRIGPDEAHNFCYTVGELW